MPVGMSAGNLFGITRIHHPGALAFVPYVLKAKSSPGVSDSLPGQKGHVFFVSVASLSLGVKNSSGRFARSVAIMTHSFVAGFCLNCGMELL
jgi:hypothetical protein